jgi:membrane protease YdiL (CAAX protease family)
MVVRQPPLHSVWWTLPLAFGLWFVTFAVPAGNFWLKLCASAAILAGVGLKLSWKERGTLFAFKPRHLWVGVSSAQLDPLVIGVLLFFVMGPAEEIYWHGFVQRRLGLRLGAVYGVLLTTVVYAAVHVSAFNFMLVVAAGICGLFWGLLYQKEKSLIPVIISHSLWDVIIFILFPLN